MIYADFSVLKRMSSLPGQDHMTGATVPHTVQGEPMNHPPVAPIYGPDVMGAE